MFLLLLSAFIIITMVILIISIITMKDYFSKILVVNSFGSVSIALIGILSIIFSDQTLIDVALIYALINFIVTISFLKFFNKKNFKTELFLEKE